MLKGPGMRDETFEVFVEEFGQGEDRVPVMPSTLDYWRGRLPAKLLDYWFNEGWGKYADGLLWIVNPEEYESIVIEWLAESPLADVDTFHVFARSAFGGLYLCGEKSAQSVKIICPLIAIFVFEKDLVEKNDDDKNISIQSFFLSEPEDFDLKDAFRLPLFKRALGKLGQLGPDEVYGFEPALVAGGGLWSYHN